MTSLPLGIYFFLFYFYSRLHIDKHRNKEDKNMIHRYRCVGKKKTNNNNVINVLLKRTQRMNVRDSVFTALALDSVHMLV